MNPPPDDAGLLLDALKATDVLTLATQDGRGRLHATSLFYALVHEPASPCLVFASKPSSEHGRHLGEGPADVAAGSYVPHGSVREIRGTQLRGEVWPIERCAPAARRRLRDGYLRRHPMAAALLAKALVTPREKAERLYVLALSWGKLTDNERLGMGVHREWSFPSARQALGLQ